MAKRFTGTDKWSKVWFQELTIKQKCLWLYLCDNCDVAGFWEENLRQATFQIGAKITRQDLTSLKDIQEFRQKVWLITDFVDFQYGVPRGSLNPENTAHRAVIRRFEKWECEAPTKGLEVGLQAPKDKDKDKDMDKDKDKDKNKEVNFESVWNEYPKRVGRPQAEKHFRATVKTPEDETNIRKALCNYLTSGNVRNGYIQNGSTWFNQWQDWVNPTETMMKGNANGTKGRGFTADISKYPTLQRKVSQS